ncbi:MAG: Flp pilus assembly complex ATPase component TadA [Peptostreptococcaceae bacterium]|nr:Flp pilus assembly complex ATPase component TadA [Peptostreptococcaceae bacterium]
MCEFFIDKYLLNIGNTRIEGGLKQDRFEEICRLVREKLDDEWDITDDKYKDNKLEREKRAIIGYEKETKYYKEKIREIILRWKLTDIWYPPWHIDLYDAIFHEVFGLSGLAPWAYDSLDKYKNSSSAKLIGDKLYCLIGGSTELQPQRINKRRREQLMRSLLLATPFENTNKGFHEVYLHNGIRITIYSGEKTKENEEVIVFRKYVIKKMSFENMVELNTIPEEAIDVFELMIKIGYNTLFAGPVRSGKTTFLQSWQMNEDTNLEGLVIATDPETPWHKLMPEAPIMQLVADGVDLEMITKSILRGDNDYVLLEEMRDGLAYNIALEITASGTKRCKATIHDNDAYNIPLKMASKIKAKYGGNIRDLIGQVFMNFDIVIELIQVPDNRSQKRMVGIKEYYYDVANDRVYINHICKYDKKNNKWLWNYRLYNDGEDRYSNELKEKLAVLYREYPLDEKPLMPGYYRSEE